MTLAEPIIASFATIAFALFVTELTDKDALLILTLSTRVRALNVFLAGATAFILTTAIIVTVGSIIVSLVPLVWVRLAGGAAMIAYGIYEARGLVGIKVVEAEESRLERTKGGWRAFVAMVTALALLDLAGDATEILTIVFLAHYSDVYLVFFGCCAGLISATALESALGNRLGRLLTPKRIRYGSVIIFLALGTAIILLSLV